MKGPFLISFSGLDGSGKTQLIILLRRFLRRQGIPYLYIHSVRDSFANRIAKRIPSFKELIRPKAVETYQFEGEEAEKEITVVKKKISSFSLVIRITILLLDALYLRLRLLYLGKNYTVIIFDRYIYDKLVQIAYLRGKEHVNFASWLLAVFPQPDMPFFLYVTPEQSMERKREVKNEGQDFEYFRKKYQLFEESRTLWRLVTIDNSILSISEAKKKILSIFKKRFFKWNKKTANR